MDIDEHFFYVQHDFGSEEVRKLVIALKVSRYWIIHVSKFDKSLDPKFLGLNSSIPHSSYTLLYHESSLLD